MRLPQQVLVAAALAVLPSRCGAMDAAACATPAHLPDPTPLPIPPP